MPAARLIAWFAFGLGVAASVAANVAHARPELGARIASGFAPVALLLTVELITRIPWPSGWGWSAGRWAGTGIVALVAAITSYRHMSDLLRSYGEDPLTAAIQPACVDGLMIVASLALLALSRNRVSSAGPVDVSTKPASTAPAPIPLDVEPVAARPMPRPVNGAPVVSLAESMAAALNGGGR